MKLRRACALMCGLLMCASTHANAGQYAATELGQSQPMWMETLASVNSEGDVAWTRMDTAPQINSTHAEFYVNDHFSLPTTMSQSWAVGVSERVQQGSTTRLGIAGSQASGQNLTDRTALLWSVDDPGATPSIQRIDLSVADFAPAMDSVQQSAAYGIYAHDTLNAYTVGGLVREKVNKTILPQPVVWTVTNAHAQAAISATVLQRYNQTPNPEDPNAWDNAAGSGYVSSIAETDGTLWACGNSTGTGGVYNQAACWQLSNPPTSVAPDAQLLPDLQSSTIGFGAEALVSSMVHRVRTLPIGPNGALRTVAVGAALVANDDNAQWKAFAYVLDAVGSEQRLYKDLNLNGDNETFAYDVAALSYESTTEGALHGMIIAGISNTVDLGNVGGLTDGVFPELNAMRGVERRMLMRGVTDDGQVCMIRDDAEEQPAHYEQLLALSKDADFRLAMAGGQLVLLNVVPQEAEVNVLQRPMSRRNNTRPALGTFGRIWGTHQQAQAVLSGEDNHASSAVLRLGSALACEAIHNAEGLSACENNSIPAAFDIEDSLSIALHAPNANQSASTLISERLINTPIQPLNHHYAQLALQGEDNCTITPVLKPANLTLSLRGEEHGPTDQDYDGAPWTWCGDDLWVDTRDDVDHCGTCDHEVKPLLDCANTVCQNGTPTVRENDVDSGSCAIGPENAWECYKYNDVNNAETIEVKIHTDYASNKCGNAQVVSRVNPCARCTANNPVDWTNLQNTTCCDSNSNVRLDVFDELGVYWYDTHRSETCSLSNDGRGIDKNDGKARYSYWEDPRVYNSSGSAAALMDRQDDYWQNAKIVYFSHPNFHPWWSQNGVCNKGTGAHQVAEHHAHFTPGIDEHDWYAATFSGGTDTSAPKASMRARLISKSDVPEAGRKVRLKMCLYIEQRHNAHHNIDIKNVYFRGAGRGEFYPNTSYNPSERVYIDLKDLKDTQTGGQLKNTGTSGRWLFDRAQLLRTATEPTTLGGTYYYNTAAHQPHQHSPAHDARGGCFETDDDGYLDISYRAIEFTNDNTGTGRAYFAVSLVEEEEHLANRRCDQLEYTLLYGNDQDGNNNYNGSVVPRRSSSWAMGCDDCCD